MSRQERHGTQSTCADDSYLRKHPKTSLKRCAEGQTCRQDLSVRRGKHCYPTRRRGRRPAGAVPAPPAASISHSTPRDQIRAGMDTLRHKIESLLARQVTCLKNYDPHQLASKLKPTKNDALGHNRNLPNPKYQIDASALKGLLWGWGSVSAKELGRAEKVFLDSFPAAVRDNPQVQRWKSENAWDSVSVIIGPQAAGYAKMGEVVGEGSYNTVLTAALNPTCKPGSGPMVFRVSRYGYSLIPAQREVAFAGMMGDMKIGPKIHDAWLADGTITTPDANRAQYRNSLVILQEGFDMDLSRFGERYGDTVDFLSGEGRLAKQLRSGLVSLLGRMANVQLYCLDIKSRNTVVRIEPGQTLTVRLIDFDDEFCSRYSLRGSKVLRRGRAVQVDLSRGRPVRGIILGKINLPGGGEGFQVLVNDPHLRGREMEYSVAASKVKPLDQRDQFLNNKATVEAMQKKFHLSKPEFIRLMKDFMILMMSANLQEWDPKISVLRSYIRSRNQEFLGRLPQFEDLFRHHQVQNRNRHYLGITATKPIMELAGVEFPASHNLRR